MTIFIVFPGFCLKQSMQDKQYAAYTGILKENAGETISCVGYIGKVGMHQTDKEIIKMMLE